MTVIGQTEDGNLSVKGLGKLYFQEGLPLSIMFDELKKRGYIPSWIHLYLELKNNGMTPERIEHLLSEQMVDTYGKQFRDIVIRRLKTIDWTEAEKLL